MNPSHDQPARMGLWAMLLCSVIAWAPTLYPGYWQSLEGFTPIFNVSAPGALANVATTADLWHGAGDGAFLLAQPFLALGATPTAAVRLSFALMLTLGGLGVYSWLAVRMGDRPAGLAGCIYLFMPSVLATVYMRGATADAMILALIPLALAGLAAYSHERSLISAAVAVAAIVLMWRTQAGLALLASLTLVMYVLTVERQRLTLLIAVVAGAAGLFTILPLWSVRAAPSVAFADFFVDLFQLFRPLGNVASTLSAGRGDFPLQIGVIVFVFAVAGGWGLLMLRPILPDDTRRLLLFCFSCGTVLLLLTFAVSEPLWRWTRAEVLLTYPWQIIILAAPFLAAAAGALVVVSPALQQPAVWSGLIVLVVTAGLPALAPHFTQTTAPASPRAVVGENIAVVLSADLQENKELGQATLTVIWQVLRPFKADDNIFFQALTRDEPPILAAQVDRQPIADRPASSWQPGEIFAEKFTLNLSEDSVGPLQYYFGFYDWRTGARRQIDGGLDDKIVFYGQ